MHSSHPSPAASKTTLAWVFRVLTAAGYGCGRADYDVVPAFRVGPTRTHSTRSVCK
jgi:hypothetical protein